MRQKKFSILCRRREGGATPRDDGQSAFIFDLLAYLFAVVGLVGCHRQWRPRRLQCLFGHLTVVDLSAGYREAQRSTFAVDDGVDFRGSTAPADTDRLIFLPPFAPLAAR